MRQQIAAGRLVSLDAFRGLTIVLMVLVNSAGSSAVYHQLQHSTWHGLTLADVIFPSFIWIVGITTVFSLSSRIEKSTKGDVVRQVMWRALKLYLFGLCLYIAPHFNLHTQRFMGVLQRIAICYLIGSLLYLYSGKRAQVACIVILLGGYWALMTLVPAPGFAAGDLSMQGNLAHFVDRVVLGSHNYAATKTWDPEGILSTFPAIATVLLGLLAGYELQSRRTLGQKAVRMLIAGAILLAAGFMVDHWFPINKKLWTSSFVLVTAGIDFLVLPVFLYLIDIKSHRRWLSPLIIVGMNAISIYLVSEFLDLSLSSLGGRVPVKSWIFQTCFEPLAFPPMASFLYAAAFTLLMCGLAYALYRKQIFLRV